MKAWKLMSRDPVLVEPRTTLRRAARLMRDHGTGILPVIGSEGLVGVLTDRDIVVRAVASDVSPLTGYVGDFMSQGVKTCGPDEDARVVAECILDRDCHRVVVVDDAGIPIGILSLDDLCRGESAAPVVARVVIDLIEKGRSGPDRG